MPQAALNGRPWTAFRNHEEPALPDKGKNFIPACFKHLLGLLVSSLSAEA